MKLYQYMIKGTMESLYETVHYSCNMSVSTYEAWANKDGVYLLDHGMELIKGNFLVTTHNTDKLLIEVDRNHNIEICMYSLNPCGKSFLNRVSNYLSTLSDCSSVYGTLAMMMRNDIPDDLEVGEGDTINYEISKRTTCSSNDQTQC